MRKGRKMDKDELAKRMKVIVQSEEDALNSMTDEEMEKEAVSWYEENPNNFSKWFPKIKDCGMLVPKSKVFKVPGRVIQAFFDPVRPEEDKIITEWVRGTVMPGIKDMTAFLFIKNGTFSDKFNFNEGCFCRKSLHELVTHITNICYDAELCGAGGLSEIVIREFIGTPYYIENNIPCIYNGMPLRPEFRVFYDFDNREVLYSVFYWDYDYCHKDIEKNATDRIIYDSVYNNIKGFYDAHVHDVEDMIAAHMKTVDMTGKWSVDVMYNEEDKTYWLIDMGTAQESAYWKEKE